MSDRSQLGEAIRRALHEAAQHYDSQKALAIRIGVTPETLSRWLKGRLQVNPKLNVLERIAEELGVTVADLLRGQKARGSTPRDVNAAVQAAVSAARDELRAELQAAFERWAQRTGSK